MDPRAPSPSCDPNRVHQGCHVLPQSRTIGQPYTIWGSDDWIQWCYWCSESQWRYALSSNPTQGQLGQRGTQSPCRLSFTTPQSSRAFRPNRNLPQVPFCQVDPSSHCSPKIPSPNPRDKDDYSGLPQMQIVVGGSSFKSARLRHRLQTYSWGGESMAPWRVEHVHDCLPDWSSQTRTCPWNRVGVVSGRSDNRRWRKGKHRAFHLLLNYSKITLFHRQLMKRPLKRTTRRNQEDQEATSEFGRLRGMLSVRGRRQNERQSARGWMMAKMNRKTDIHTFSACCTIFPQLKSKASILANTYYLFSDTLNF